MNSMAFLKSWSPPAYLLWQLHSTDYAAGYFCLNVCWLKRPGILLRLRSTKLLQWKDLPPSPPTLTKHLHTNRQILRAPFVEEITHPTFSMAINPSFPMLSPRSIRLLSELPWSFSSVREPTLQRGLHWGDSTYIFLGSFGKAAIRSVCPGLHAKSFLSAPTRSGNGGVCMSGGSSSEGCREGREPHWWQMGRESREGAAVMNHCMGTSPAGCKESQTARTKRRSKKGMRETVQCCCSSVPSTR